MHRTIFSGLSTAAGRRAGQIYEMKSTCAEVHYDSRAGGGGRAPGRAAAERTPLQRFHNDAKRGLLAEFLPSGGGGSVLDLACGRGGDLHKWLDLGVVRATGLDVSGASVEEARARLAARAAAARAAGATYLFERADLRRREGWSDGSEYDVVSCMFALHYFFESEAAARALLRTAAGCLRPGGVFLGIVPDGKSVNALLAARPAGGGDVFDNGVMRLAARWHGRPRPFGSGFGCSVRGTVTEGSDDCVTEYLVYDSVLTALAAEAGLRPCPIRHPAFVGGHSRALHPLAPPYRGPAADCSRAYAGFAFRKMTAL